MKKWKKLSARGFALFLALIMCLSAMQLTAFAEDAKDGPTDPAEDVDTPGSLDDSTETGDDNGGTDGQETTVIESIYDEAGNVIGTRTTVYDAGGKVVSSYEETHTSAVDGNTVTNTDNTSSYESTEDGETTGNTNRSETTEYDEQGRPVNVSGEERGETTSTENSTATEKREESETVESAGSGSASSETAGTFEETDDSEGGSFTQTGTDSLTPGYAGDVTVNLTPDSAGSGSASLTDQQFQDLVDSQKPDMDQIDGDFAHDEDGNTLDNKKVSNVAPTEEKTEETSDILSDGEVIGKETVSCTDNGGTKTTTVDPYVENGKHVGWTTTEVTETSKTIVTVRETEAVKTTVTDTKGRPIPEEGEHTNEDGSAYTVSYEYGEDGSILSYTVETPILDEDGKKIGSSTESHDVPQYQPDYIGVIPGIPEETAAPVVTTDAETGAVTSVEIAYAYDEDGSISGYTKTTTVESVGADGRVETDITVETYTITGVSQEDATETTDTIRTTTTTTVTVTTKKTHVTKTAVAVSDRTVTGSMGEESNSSSSSTVGTNGQTLSGIGPSTTTLTDAAAGRNHLTTTGIVTGSHLEDCIKSTITITGTGTDGKTYKHPVRMYKLTDENGNTTYVYCVQAGLQYGRDYSWNGKDFDDYIGEHQADLGSWWYTGEYSSNNLNWNITASDAAHVQYIIQNAWWGTDSGVGSLQAVKDFAGISNSTLDEGVAMAVVQAALWHFTTPNEGGEINFNSINNIPTDQKEAAQKLYDALVAGDETIQALDKKGADKEAWVDYLNGNTDTTDFIQSSDKVFTGSSITVGQKVDGTSSLYNADLSVTISIVPSRINSDDMILIVRNSRGEELGRQRLKNGVSDGADGTTITFKNLQLPSGESITLELTGTQTLAGGSYVFNCASNTAGKPGDYNLSQTMAGYIATAAPGSKKNNVNVSTTITFNVTEGTATVTTYESDKTEQKTDTEMASASEIETTERVTSNVTTVLEITIVENDAWSRSWDYNYSYNDEIIPGDDDDGDDDGPRYYPGDDDDDDDDVTVPDAPTPLAGTPVDITDAPTPLTGAPAADAGQPEEEDLELPETPIPLADTPSEEEPAEEEELELPDGDIPLADIPVTGDSSAIWYALTGLSVLGLAILAVLGRKREEEQR